MKTLSNGTTMDKKLKTAWVKALRSGKYIQGRQGLRASGKYCCLGVLCDIHPKVSWSLVDDNDPTFFSAVYEGSETAFLPRAFREELGLSQQNESALVHLNDMDQKPFKKIADWIEETL